LKGKLDGMAIGVADDDELFTTGAPWHVG